MEFYFVNKKIPLKLKEEMMDLYSSMKKMSLRKKAKLKLFKEISSKILMAMLSNHKPKLLKFKMEKMLLKLEKNKSLLKP